MWLQHHGWVLSRVLPQDLILVPAPHLVVFPQYEAGFWKALMRRALRVVAYALVHRTLHSELGRPWENACDSSKVLSVALVNFVFFLWFKVHITKLSNLKTSVIDYNVRAEILSMGMGIDNSEHVEQLKKLYKGAKMPSFEESLNQTL